MTIPRQAETQLRKLAGQYPVVAITGPRQAGKTTLARTVFPGKNYLSLENPDTRYLAQTDPRSFLDRCRQGAVLDEIQRCPDLLSYLQELVDAEPLPGRFILTGSQQFGLLSNLTQSLAGRVALLQLLPFSLAERRQIGASAGLPKLPELLFAGFYPPVHDRRLEPATWYANYVQTYVERDVRQLLNVKDLSTFQRFLRLCAGRCGQLLNLSQLASDSGISHTTARAWISILEASYILFLLQPHHENFNKRLIKAPKLYFHDPGLCAWLLMIQSPEQLDLHPARGALFETFVVTEALKSRLNRGLAGNLFFWRDQGGHEVDLVADQGLKLLPVEIKSGQTLAADFFTGLERWRRIAGPRGADPLLVYGGNQTLRHGATTVFSWHDPAWPELF
ncbi:MAG: ATP-binding protein [Lentisphaeria bacterium]|jgi:hypothetical protein